MASRGRGGGWGCRVRRVGRRGEGEVVLGVVVLVEEGVEEGGRRDVSMICTFI